jgi:PASTA domain/Glucodextranase, domain B
MPANATLAARAGGLALLLALSGCSIGGGDDTADPPAQPAVRLDVSAPADTAVLHDESVDVSGSVDPPRSRVLVLGQPARVVNGRFSTRVPLREGANVIDVGASARGAASAWTAVRVVRESLVEVPDVGGESRDDAVSAIEALGLQADVREERGILDEFLPGEPRVCDQRPRPGAEVAKGARVRVTVSKTC